MFEHDDSSSNPVQEVNLEIHTPSVVYSVKAQSIDTDQPSKLYEEDVLETFLGWTLEHAGDHSIEVAIDDEKYILTMPNDF